MVVPFLMMEEKQTKTMDALLVSPASPGQVVLGKALAGIFYVLISGGLFFALNWAYITSWGLALLGFICTILFSIGLALLIGNIVKTPQQLSIWAFPLLTILLVPAFFSQEPLLAPGLKAVFSWLPTTALVEIFQFSFSTHAPTGGLVKALGIALTSTVVIFWVVIWQVRRSDR